MPSIFRHFSLKKRYRYLYIFLFFLAYCSKAENHQHQIFPFDRGRFAIPYDNGFTTINHRDKNLLQDSPSCQKCHKVIYNNWYKSQHKASFTNPFFKEGYANEPMEWCLNCHAPFLTNTGQRVLPEEGISCLVCHVRNKKILVSVMPAKKEGKYVHDYKVAPEMSTANFCANCHQFPFPASDIEPDTNPIHYSNVAMQNTFQEWQKSSFSQKSNCQTCHLMSRTDKSHTFPGGHDLKRISAAIELYAKRVNKDTVLIQVISLGIGHRFPTGDLFRTLRIKFYSSNSLIKGLLLRKTYENNHLSSPDLANKKLVHDTTIPPPSQTDYAAFRNFYLDIPATINRLDYKIYMDYLNAVNHIITKIPFAQTMPLIREGKIQIIDKR